MHMVSTAALCEIANNYDACAQYSGSARENLLTSSPDILHLQAVQLFVLLASVQEV
jgi:hypothetical protein